MKNTALTVGAVTLLGQGIGLAAGTGSGSGSLSYLHISDTRTSDLNREIVVPRGEDITETISNVANALWEALGNEVGNYEIGNPNNYKSSTNVRITAYNQSGQVTANNTYTAFFGGPITIIKYRLEPV